MKAIYWTIAAAVLAFVQAAPANAGVNDPEVVIYRFPGTADNGGASGTGFATVFHCTNFSGVTEVIRFVMRDGLTTTIKGNFDTPIDHLVTKTIATKNPSAYTAVISLNTGAFKGTTAIAATSPNIICTAMTINAGLAEPVGVSLRGIRFNPAPGSQE